MAKLRPRERWFLGFAAILAATTLGYLYVVEPLIAGHRETGELIAARQALLARQQRLLTRQGRYAADLEALQAEIAERRARLLAGDRAPLAASELQKLVKATAQDTGVEVRSERILPPVDRGGYTEVPIEVTLSGPVRALTSLIYRLEAAPVTVTLSDVKLRVVSITAPRELSATLALAGYIPAAASPGPPAGPTPSRGPATDAGRGPGA